MNSVLPGHVSMCKTESSVADSSSIKTKSQAASSRSSNSQDESRGSERPAVPQSTESVVVAVNASKEITKHALEWALTNIVQPGDQITLVAIFQGARNAGKKLWGLPMFPGDCANGSIKGPKSGNPREMEEEVTVSCSNMMKQLHKLCDSKKVKVSVKVVSAAGRGTAALEAQRVNATWVVLDSQLKKEGKWCMEQLNCNLVIVKRFSPKILRLNLRSSSDNLREPSEEASSTQGSEENAQREASCQNVKATSRLSARGTSVSSPDVGTPFTATEQATSGTSSSEPCASPLMSGEVVALLNSGQNFTDTAPVSFAPEDGADDVSETDSATDFGLADARSESSSDESDMVHRISPTASPERRSSNHSAVKYFQQNDSMPQPWLDYSLIGVQRDSYLMDPWKPLAKTRPNSANATPILNSKQGRLSTPASPLSSSLRFSGNARLSFSMREGGSGRNTGAGTYQGNSPVLGLKNDISCNTQLPPDQSDLKSSVQSFDLDKGNWPKRVVTTKELLEKFSKWDHESGVEVGDNAPNVGELERASSVRKAMSLSRNVPPGPPPLCSICQHKAPVFGKPPRRFTYADLELATGGFSQANFLAEGGFGSVHRGVLPDGQAVAVKQHKLASSQGDIEFCSEVEVLSCAQHRNVVMLIGYCIEDKRRLLVYEFICNGSLDSHLYGRDKECLAWPARQKIAVGAARGLRYLHEECRVGCIVHRDMRPNNILLTHDFEPMVGDFGLARWQPDGDLGVQTRVIGTFGYLAPEYAQSGQITEKADVYSFGVVLLELATGRKAVDLNRPKGQQCLTEWARPLLEDHLTQHLIDPLLNGRYSDYEVYCMLHAASLCVRKDPHVRPRMSQVLRILEGDIVIDTSGPSTPCYSSRLAYDTALYGSRSSRISSDYFNRLAAFSPPLVSYSGSLGADFLSRRLGKLSAFGEPPSSRHGKLSYEALKAAYKDRDSILRLSYEDMI